MSVLRKLTFRNLDWLCSVEFLPDRIEILWDLGGYGKDKRRKIVLRQDLSPYLTEAMTETGFYSLKPFRLAGVYLILAMFAYAVLRSPWHYSSYFFLACFLLAIYRGFKVFPKSQWIQILTKDGRVSVSVLTTKWSEDEKAAFRRFYSEWIKDEVNPINQL